LCRRQKALLLLRIYVNECQERHSAVVGFHLDGFMSWPVSLFKTDVRGFFDDLGDVGFEAPPDYDINARCPTFRVCADAD
jgi:hypothetical protein